MENDKPIRPEFLTDESWEEYRLYLNQLRKSGVCNMWAGAIYLQDMFSELGRKESKAVLFYWMKTFEKEMEIEQLR